MNTTNRPVVVGIGDKQPTALRFALQEAQRRGAELRVVHSAGVPAQAAAFYVGAEMLEGLLEGGQKVLDDAQHFVEGEGSSVHVTYVLTPAAPIEALEAAAHEANPLIIGADDISWPDRLLGGAIASHIALHAPCPVIVVPERTYPTPLAGGVLIALDGDTSARGPIQFAFEAASERDNVLHVLHAIPPATTTEDAEGMRANVGEILAGWADTYPDVHVYVTYSVDDPEEACIRATGQSELVVIGRPHRHALPFALARPLAAEVLKHAHCPVAVVPSDYRGA
ncbi:universal stress protein [Aeromicrobium sp.]|uniref:universal stress protein n=1 Tax=Aeromicrobium sp. TaxID=1871063 RepID=UPI002FC91661